MANFSELKTQIAAAIYPNDEQLIDAVALRGVLDAMVDALGDGFLFKGLATTDGNPGTPDTNVFYVATTPGTYTNYGGLTVSAGEVAFFTYDGTWAKITSGALSTAAIADDLTTDDATKVLSAKQGKGLGDRTKQLELTGAMDVSGIVDAGTTYDANNSAVGTARASVFYPLDGRSRRFRIELSDCVFTEDVTQIYIRFTNAISVSGGAAVQNCPRVGIASVAYDVELTESNLASAKYLAIFAGATDAGASFKAKVTNLDAAAAITRLNGNDLQHSAELIALHGGEMPVSISSGNIITSGATQSIMPSNPPRIRTSMLPIGHLPLTLSIPSASVAIVTRVCFYSTFGDWNSFSHREEYAFNLVTKSVEITEALAKGAQGIAIAFANKNGSNEPISISDGAGIVLTAGKTELGEIASRLLNNSFVGKTDTFAYRDIYGLVPGRKYRVILKSITWDISDVTSAAVWLFGASNYYGGVEEALFHVTVPNAATLQDHYDFVVPANSDYVRIGGRANYGTIVDFAVEDITTYSEVEQLSRIAGQGLVNFDPVAVVRGTIYNGNVSTSVTQDLYCPDYVRVYPGTKIQCHHGTGITLRISEYDAAKAYVRNSGSYAALTEYELSPTTCYVRISAEYPSAVLPADYTAGDFGFSYQDAPGINGTLRLPIEGIREAKFWIDGHTWKAVTAQYGAFVIAVAGGTKIAAKANANVTTRIAFANSYDPASIHDGDDIDGLGNQNTAAGQSRVYDVPDACQYIVLSCRYGSNAAPNALPVSLVIDGKEWMLPLPDAVQNVARNVQAVDGLPSGLNFDIFGRNLAKDAAVRATGTRVNNTEIVPLSFVHVSDIHTKGDNYKCFLNAMRYLQHYAALKFGIVTGDLVWDNFADAMTWYDLAVAQTTKPVLNVIGNHDAGQQNNTTPSLDYVSSDLQLYNKAIAPYVSGWGVTQPTDAATLGKSYYYKDFTDEKIRLIVLNEFETDYQIDPNNANKLLYSREYRAMHQAQVDWLIASLAATPDDYGVVVAYHQPDDNIANDGNPFVSIDLVGRTGWPANIYSETRNWLPRILNAFATKTADSFTFSQTGAVVGTINVSCDFTANQAEFICILNGHTHRDIIGRLTDYPDLLILCVGADNLLYTSNFCPRAEGTPSEDLFNVVNIDRNRKTIKVIRIGSDASITGQVRDQLLISYASHTL